MDPDVNLLMRLKKAWLQIKAKELGLLTTGTKYNLAIRIAIKQHQNQSKAWAAIAQ